MSDPRDFLPQPPWEGPPIPRTFTKVRTFYHESPWADKIIAEGFRMDIERRRDPGDFGWGVYLWPMEPYGPKQNILKVDVDLSKFAIIHDPYTPPTRYGISYDTPEETLFRKLIWGKSRWMEEAMTTIHTTIENSHEITREEAAKRVRDKFLNRGIQGLITFHNHQRIEEIVVFDLDTIKSVRRLVR